ncbi:MAG TPA: hypothetical protein VFQ41_22830, partial [Candidatus Angelobacter sp.]|nr:hypothetical protein [Candidatus Angelobacter sp.]
LLLHHSPLLRHGPLACVIFALAPLKTIAKGTLPRVSTWALAGGRNMRMASTGAPGSRGSLFFMLYGREGRQHGKAI